MLNSFPGAISWTIRKYSLVIPGLISTDLCVYFSRLLVGVDEERKQIACGLVDTIGAVSLFFSSLLMLNSPFFFFFFGQGATRSRRL